MIVDMVELQSNRLGLYAEGIIPQSQISDSSPDSHGHGPVHVEVDYV